MIPRLFGSAGAVTAIVGMLFVAGCSGSTPPPLLYPVQGKVLKAGQAITAGTVQFQSIKEPGHTTLGDIESDGSFTLATVFENKRLAGAVAGEHRATVILPAGGANRSITPVEIEPVFVVEAGENNFTIHLEKARKTR